MYLFLQIHYCFALLKDTPLFPIAKRVQKDAETIMYLVFENKYNIASLHYKWQMAITSRPRRVRK